MEEDDDPQGLEYWVLRAKSLEIQLGRTKTQILDTLTEGYAALNHIEKTFVSSATTARDQKDVSYVDLDLMLSIYSQLTRIKAIDTLLQKCYPDESTRDSELDKKVRFFEGKVEEMLRIVKTYMDEERGRGTEE